MSLLNEMQRPADPEAIEVGNPSLWRMILLAIGNLTGRAVATVGEMPTNEVDPNVATLLGGKGQQ